MNKYEVSSKGDKRFSAFYARLEDGRSIEEWYQCDVKGWDIGGRNWRLGKGKPPKISMTREELFADYVALWVRYLTLNPTLNAELRLICAKHHLVDCFARGPVNQAAALEYIIHNKEPLVLL